MRYFREPTPRTGIAWGPSFASSYKVSEALRSPTAVGVNWNVTLHVLKAGRVEPQVFSVIAKSCASPSVNRILPKSAACGPEL